MGCRNPNAVSPTFADLYPPLGSKTIANSRVSGKESVGNRHKVFKGGLNALQPRVSDNLLLSVLSTGYGIKGTCKNGLNSGEIRQHRFILCSFVFNHSLVDSTMLSQFSVPSPITPAPLPPSVSPPKQVLLIVAEIHANPCSAVAASRYLPSAPACTLFSFFKSRSSLPFVEDVPGPPARIAKSRL
ncbi:5832_t:CDS:2 [Ambispora gerdemannii]|uniref:5832_t:CDS:1 n=1 Tax=Ambispora gerdemannii TaxID=144530 RepID=A0A9N8VQY9_9GLOM|nr:5832_t:CDS:2 [Ambispora gerdemannii]